MREHKPPILVVWGRNDPSFIAPGAEGMGSVELANVLLYSSLRRGNFYVPQPGWTAFALKVGEISGVGERTYGSVPAAFGEDVSSFQVEDLSIGWRSGGKPGKLSRFSPAGVTWSKATSTRNQTHPVSALMHWSKATIQKSFESHKKPPQTQRAISMCANKVLRRQSQGLHK